MIHGGNATIFVSNMDRAVRFYTETLGLALQYRAGDHWAQVDAGGMPIGLHPTGPEGPKPGPGGSIQVGLNVTEPIDEVVTTLRGRGVTFKGPVVDDGPVKLASFCDPDGNDLYLCQVMKP